MRSLALGVAGVFAWLHVAEAAEPTGEWIVDGGYGRVRIENCGGKMWGVVSSEKSPGTDRNNPDPSKRARATLGLPILIAMAPSSTPNRWNGEIYNTEDGRLYTGSISLSSSDVLHVEGCVLGVLCGVQDWTRYKEAPAQTGTRPGGRSGQRADAGRESTAQLCTRVTGDE